jgi:hypothetical protein
VYIKKLIQCGRCLVRYAIKVSSQYKATVIIIWVSKASLWYSQAWIIKCVVTASRRKTSRPAVEGRERKVTDYWILWEADQPSYIEWLQLVCVVVLRIRNWCTGSLWSEFRPEWPRIIFFAVIWTIPSVVSFVVECQTRSQQLFHVRQNNKIESSLGITTRP